MDATKCQELSSNIIELVGGRENVEHVLHCATRLRFNLRDYDKADIEAIRKLDVVGCQQVQGQLQIIVGTEVGQVYDEVCKQGNFDAKAEVPEDDKPRDLSPKGIALAVMDAISGCVNPILPVIIAAGMVKLLVTILGPAFTGLVTETSDLYRLLTFVGDAGFYFFPMYVAYAAAKKFDTSVPLALLLGGILLHPTWNAIVAEGEPFTVYGIPATLASYASNFIPMILITWVMSYVERFMTKYMPSAVKVLLVPTCTLLVMLPLALCVLGPLGVIIGNGIAAFMTWLHATIGGFSTMLVGAFWYLLVATGMHQALIAIALGQMASVGFDDSILVGALVGTFSMFAISLAYAIKSKDADERAKGFGYFVTCAIGGISEPTIFGILFQCTRAWLYVFAGGAAGGLIAGLMGAKVYFFSGLGNVFCLLGFAGDDPGSIVWATVASVVAFAVTLVLGLVLGFPKKDEA